MTGPLLALSAALSNLRIAHKAGEVAGSPAIVGKGFTVTREGAGFMLEVGDLGIPCEYGDDVIWELSQNGVRGRA